MAYQLISSLLLQPVQIPEHFSPTAELYFPKIIIWLFYKTVTKESLS
jgi:hypothetical protein